MSHHLSPIENDFMQISRTGCACRFLYGPETKDDLKNQIEASLDGKCELKLEVIFYKKNGEYTASNTNSAGCTTGIHNSQVSPSTALYLAGVDFKFVTYF
jgi:hypothetical protein